MLPSNGFVFYADRSSHSAHASRQYQIANNASSSKGSIAKGFLVGGDSAGGNLAAAVSIKARDDPDFVGKAITGQFLREPVTIHKDAWPVKWVYIHFHHE